MTASGDPYARRGSTIPVTIVSQARVAGATAADVAIVRLERPRHAHAGGAECAACAAGSDIRAILFDLLEAARQGRRPPFERVIVDASGLVDPAEVVDRLVPGRVPATGLRDHAVARNFRLEAVH